MTTKPLPHVVELATRDITVIKGRCAAKLKTLRGWCETNATAAWDWFYLTQHTVRANREKVGVAFHFANPHDADEFRDFATGKRPIARPMPEGMFKGAVGRAFGPE